MTRLILTVCALLCASLPVNAQAVAVAPLTLPRAQFLSATGVPLASGCVNFFATGTSTPQAIFADSGGVNQLANPLQLDAAGEASVWLSNVGYDIVANAGVPGTACSVSLGSQLWKEINKNPFAIINSGSNYIVASGTSDPAGSPGMLGYRSDLPCFRGFTTIWDCFVQGAAVQILTNKTLVSPIITSPSINGVTPSVTAPTVGQVYTATSSSTAAFQSRVVSIPFIIDGAGSTITTGSKGFLQIPFNCSLVSWTLLADQAGSIVIDVKSSSYAGFPTTTTITGGDKPTLIAQQKNQNPLITQWAGGVAAGNILEFTVNSATTVTRVTLSITATLP